MRLRSFIWRLLGSNQLPPYRSEKLWRSNCNILVFLTSLDNFQTLRLPFAKISYELASVSIKHQHSREACQSRNIHNACMFSSISQLCHTGNIVSSVHYCFQDGNYAPATRWRILMKIRACEQLQNVCEHEQASTRPSLRAIRAKVKFDQILWAHLKWMGPFHTPST